MLRKIVNSIGTYSIRLVWIIITSHVHCNTPISPIWKIFHLMSPRKPKKNNHKMCTYCAHRYTAKKYSKNYKVSQRARKLKKIQAKNSWNQINQFHEKKFFDQIPFLQFKKWPKINFSTGKKFKTAKNAISRNWFISFHEFFCCIF